MTRILAALALALTAALASPAVAAPRHKARAFCTPIVVEGVPGRFCAVRGR